MLQSVLIQCVLIQRPYSEYPVTKGPDAVSPDTECPDCGFIVFFSTDIATVVGYLSVSKPFLDLSDPRHRHSTHAEIMLVRGGAGEKGVGQLRDTLCVCVCPPHTGLLSEWAYAGAYGGSHRKAGVGWKRDDKTLRVGGKLNLGGWKQIAMVY